ncbi:MAG: DNA alkylation repair protein [Bacteroidota bacterium]
MAELLKNLYNPDFIQHLADQLRKAKPDFQVQAFQDAVLADPWPTLELKARTQHITDMMHQFLGVSFAEGVDYLGKVAPHFDGYLAMIFPNYVETYGLDEDWEVVIPALEWFTQFSSSEFAVRPFILQDPKRMMAQMEVWSHHENHHVRRLASEGCRPRLPWGKALNIFKKDPEPILPILYNLKADASDYVRRSVANNLNDISKDHPSRVLEVGEEWIGQQKETDWIVKHALRTLLKQGNTRALRIFGFGDPKDVIIRDLKLNPPYPQIGDKATIHCNVEILKPSKVRLEYIVDFLKANGKHNPKVFQISENTFEKATSFDLGRMHDFRQMSTRKHYAGVHYLRIIANGEEKAKIQFDLLSD